MPSIRPTTIFIVVTDPATNVTSFPVGSAVLNGQIRADAGANITCYFEYATDPNSLMSINTTTSSAAIVRAIRRKLHDEVDTLPSSLIATGNIEKAEPATAMDLAPATYYFQIIGYDSATSEMRLGGIREFVIRAEVPTAAPSHQPTPHPSQRPTFNGETYRPTIKPTQGPTLKPSPVPSMRPTFIGETYSPTERPSVEPTPGPAFTVVTDPATNVTNTPVGSGTLNGHVQAQAGANVTYYFEYSTDSKLLMNSSFYLPSRHRRLHDVSRTPTVSYFATGGIDQAQPVTISPLAAGVYYFQLIGYDSVTQQTKPGGIRSFTIEATEAPTSGPTPRPTFIGETYSPTEQPSEQPSQKPSTRPTFTGETYVPTQEPSQQPSKTPTPQPTSKPTFIGETYLPTRLPSQRPSPKPSLRPTFTGETYEPTEVHYLYLKKRRRSNLNHASFP